MRGNPLRVDDVARQQLIAQMSVSWRHDRRVVPPDLATSHTRGTRTGAAMSQNIVDFTAPLAAESSAPAADRLISGDPAQQIANHYADASQQFFAGTWSSTVGKWRIRYSESEFCCLTRGRVALQSGAGERWEFGPGAAFVVPAGFEGTWEVLEPCTKFYAIFEART
jgi:uncharacterized cupin superfamily protein